MFKFHLKVRLLWKREHLQHLLCLCRQSENFFTAVAVRVLLLDGTGHWDSVCKQSYMQYFRHVFRRTQVDTFAKQNDRSHGGCKDILIRVLNFFMENISKVLTYLGRIVWIHKGTGRWRHLTFAVNLKWPVDWRKNLVWPFAALQICQNELESALLKNKFRTKLSSKSSHFLHILRQGR